MKTIEVVAAIIEQDGKILATQRGYGDLAGGWEFPGGKIEPDEDAEQAVVREIEEELAAIVDVDSFIVTVDYDYEKFHLTMHCFLAHLAEGENVTLLEHSAAKWVGSDDVDAVEWLPADILVVDALKEQGII